MLVRNALLTSGATLFLVAAASWLQAQTVSLDPAQLELHNTKVEQVNFKGKKALKAMISDEAARQAQERRRRRAAAKKATKKGGRPNFRALEANRVSLLVFPKTEDFSSGTIELDLAGQAAPGASGGARGFVGVAWRVQPDKKTYDCFYLRPTNGRAEDQERRNHSAQYISHPEFPWFRLRSETPSKYEAYVDIVPAEWIHVKIDVNGDKARLYVKGNEQPTLIVNDVKSGADVNGAIALWLEGSTIAHFANLKVTRR